MKPVHVTREHVYFDADEYRRSRRVETRGLFGRLIAAPDVKIKVAKYTDASGLPHAGIAIVDPLWEGGEPRTYLIPRQGLIDLARDLMRLAQEVPA